ncbi:MAG: thermonuclease family protein [Nanoarchaeota archaeon]|nr:thermonuclease family protein [Nanoarchaeota archaeon]
MRYRRTVKRVIDGDTFLVKRAINGTSKIRLSGVNAPEKHQFGGPTATNVLRGLIGGEKVTVTPVGRSYDRIVAGVTQNRRNINKRMNQKGY